jgi:DNA-binding beta-propeller fold protein YncE
LAKLLEVDPERRGDVQIAGSSLDPSGSLLLAVPVRFRVYEVTREGKVTQFGKAGSAPGLFGIVSGVAGDPHGRIFVADKLRSVVMVFDRERQFVTEFGGRGLRPDQLITPGELVLGRGDTLFVTQGRKRGVSVFAIAAAGEAKSPGAAR